MSSIEKDETNVDIDLGSLFFAVRRHIVKIIIAVIIFGALAFILVNMMSEKYRAEARILIDNREPVFNDQQSSNPNVAANVLDDAGVISQVEILKSNDLVKAVALELDLASYSEFDAPKNPSFIGEIFISLGLMSDPYKVPAEERVLKEFYERLAIYQVEQSRVIAIEFTSENAELASKVPNAMADAFLRLQSGEKLRDNSDASAWLEPEIERLRQRVQEAEAHVANYRAEKGLFLVGETDTLNGQQLSDLSAELTRVRSERVDAEARATTVRRVLENGQDIDAIADVLDSTTVQRLRENEGDIRANIADLSTTLLEAHPRMQALRSQLIDVQRQLRSEARKILASLENEASVAQLRERDLIANLNSIKADSAQAGGQEVQLRALEREAASQRELLETYLARFREAASRTQASAVPPNARVISRAIEPTEAYFPKKIPTIAAVMFVTFIMAAIWIMLAELFSGRALRQVASNPRADDAAGDNARAQPTFAEPAQYAVGDEAQHNSENGSPAEPQVRPQEQIPDQVHAAAQHQAQIKAKTQIQSQAQNQAQYPGATDDTTPIAGSLLDGYNRGANKQLRQPLGQPLHAVVSEFQIARPPVVICLSPEGEGAVAGSILLSRHLSDSGHNTILIDLTLDGGPSGSMIGSSRVSGVTNLLCGETGIADAIHCDHSSMAHIMARGNGNVQKAMRAAERIPIIVGALTETYDTVIIECGATSIQSALRLVQNNSPEFVVSVKSISEPDIEAVKHGFSELGFHDILVLDLNYVPETDHDEAKTNNESYVA